MAFQHVANRLRGLTRPRLRVDDRRHVNTHAPKYEITRIIRGWAIRGWCTLSRPYLFACGLSSTVGSFHMLKLMAVEQETGPFVRRGNNKFL